MAVPTLALALILYVTGSWLWRRVRGHVARGLLLLIALPLAAPALLFAAYYLHCFDRAAWFYQFRSLPGSELMAGGAGLLAGLLAAVMDSHPWVRRPFLPVILALGVVGPHLKPILAPLPASRFQDRWEEGVCLQSTSASCGAASAATLLRGFGVDRREAEIARRCFTYLGGTENWYLARYLRQEGVAVRFITNHAPAAPLPVPSMAGVRLGGVGHFIPIIAETATTYVTGDPLTGRQEWPKDQIRRHFEFTGFFMELHKEGLSHR